MASTLRAVLDQHATALVGREREQAQLLELVQTASPIAVWVHGIAGAGKSSLLRAFAARARDRGAAVVALDCRTVEPTEAGFLAALSQALGSEIGSVPAAAATLRGRGERVVIALDAYELLSLLDTWVRQTLLPALPIGARLAVCSREPPLPAWRSELGPLLRTIALGSLEPADAEALLVRAGVPAEQAARVNRYAHGHPLSLRLAASALAERPGLALEDSAIPTVAAALAGHYLDGLDPATRRALDAASVTRRTTLSLLGALLPDEPAHDAFARLRALPFAELGPYGLVLEDTVREAVAALLRAADPVAHRRLRAVAWRQLRSDSRDAPPTELWRYTADMLYLIENPLVRGIYFPTGAPRQAIQPARPEDWPGMEAIASRHQPEAAVALLRRWWEAAPETFMVSHDDGGSVQGYYSTFMPGQVSPRLIDADPLTRAWREHLRANPLPHGQVALFIRHALTRSGGKRPAAGEPSLCLDMKRTFLELRPALGRLYLSVSDLEDQLEPLSQIGFEEAPGYATEIGGVELHTLFSDFGPGSVEGWIADIGARELQLDGERVIDAAERRLVLDGRHVDLTRLEHGLLRHLHSRDGRAVARSELFREVWGHDWVGDGNAIEAVVSSLRRKLGAQAGALETVRGVGYRLRPLT